MDKTLEALTISELKLTAMVAGFKFDEQPLLADRHVFVYINGQSKEWLPNEDRNQIAMIIEGFTEEQHASYDNKMSEIWGEITSRFQEISFGQTVDPAISARCILETLEQEKV